jgi:MarR family transcriptional regulator, organic hydroperoxide resistance regulator
VDEAELHGLFSDLKGVQVQLADAVRARLRRDFGLTVAMLSVMQVLHEAGRCRVRELAASLRVSAGGASKLVDRLENMGLCQRTANPLDRRSSLLELTESGRQACDEAARAVMDEVALQLGPALSESQIGQLGAILGELRAAAGQRDPWQGRPPRPP